MHYVLLNFLDGGISRHKCRIDGANWKNYHSDPMEIW